MTFEGLVEMMKANSWSMSIDYKDVVEAVRHVTPYLVEEGIMWGGTGMRFDVWYKIGKVKEWEYDEWRDEMTRGFECLQFHFMDDSKTPNKIQVYHITTSELENDKRRITARDLIHDIDLGEFYEYIPRKK